MLKLIGILVISGKLAVAVETNTGFVERTFSNTPAGVEQFIEFAQATLLPEEPPLHIVVGLANEREDDGPILRRLAQLKIANGRVSPEELQSFAKSHNVSIGSPTTVALLYKQKFPFLFVPRKKHAT